MQNLPVKSIEHNLQGWNFFFSESGISNSKEIEELAENLHLFQTPHIVFGKNILSIKHLSGFKLEYTAYQALKLINYNERQNKFQKIDFDKDIPVNHITYIPERVEVQHAEHWKNIKKPQDIQISKIEEISDSFFITSFKGHVLTSNSKILKVKQDVIPVSKLGPHNQIKFYQQGSLYEDELDDNGLSQYQYKFRTMSDSWFGLIRFYLRVDSVCIYILDTRIYWQKQFGKKIARQFMVKKATWQQISNKGFKIGVEFSMNPNQSHLVYPYLQTVFVDNQYIIFES